MIETMTARELQPGDELSTSGAVIEQTVLCGHGAKVYIRARFDDGYVQVVTTNADTVVHVWRAETCPDLSADCRKPGCVHTVAGDAAKEA